jgi:hypothetical protein
MFRNAWLTKGTRVPPADSRHPSPTGSSMTLPLTVYEMVSSITRHSARIRMPRHDHLRRSFTLALLVLAGCSTTPDNTAGDIYHPPAAGTPMAQIKGTMITEGGLFGNTYTSHVFMVDLLSVQNPDLNGEQPVAVSPGRHDIGAEFRYSNFKSRAYLPLDAKAGATYQVMIKPGRDDTPEGHQFNDFWIVDLATGQPVTKTYRRDVTGGKKGTIFYNNK